MSHRERSRVVPALLETEPAATSYSGPVDDATGLARGEGRATYEDGSEYEGEFLAGARHGFGTLLLAEDESDEDEDSGDDDKQRARYVGSWSEDEPHGCGEQISSDGCVLKGIFNHGELIGDVVMTAEDGETKRYVGGLDEYGTYAGCGSVMGEWGGLGCLTANRSRGEISSGVALWQEEVDGRLGVLAWTRASFGVRTRRARGDLCCECGALLVTLRDTFARDPRQFVATLNARIDESGITPGKPFEFILPIAQVDVKFSSRDAVSILKEFEARQVSVTADGVHALHPLRTGEHVGYFTGTYITVAHVTTSQAIDLASNSVMIRDDAPFDVDVVRAHDEDTPFCVTSNIPLVRLDANGLSANTIRIESKFETNCVRTRVEGHPILGEIMSARAAKPISAGEVCTLAPDYFLGWCLNPKSEAGYYVSMWSHSARELFKLRNAVPELGEVCVKQYGRWRVLYMGSVEQGLSYERADGDGACTQTLGFEYIRSMADAALSRFSRFTTTGGTNAHVFIAVGLGTGALPTFLARRLVENGTPCRVVAVERSQSVVEACKRMGVPIKELNGLRDHDAHLVCDAQVDDYKTCHVVRSDALSYFAALPRGKATCVLLDAYDGDGRVPDHIASDEFIRYVRLSLRRGGVIVCNCWNGALGTREGDELARFQTTLRRHIGDVCVETVTQQEHNVVLVATKTR